MESNTIKKEKLIELANLLIKDIKTKNDLFETTIIVVPDKRLGAWFKSLAKNRRKCVNEY